MWLACCSDCPSEIILNCHEMCERLSSRLMHLRSDKADNHYLRHTHFPALRSDCVILFLPFGQICLRRGGHPHQCWSALLWGSGNGGVAPRRGRLAGSNSQLMDDLQTNCEACKEAALSALECSSMFISFDTCVQKLTRFRCHPRTHTFAPGLPEPGCSKVV